MITPSRRTASFQYAIRHLVDAAETLERAGQQVLYLNIGDPQVFGFRPPEHVVEATARALRDDFSGYTHSMGMPEARESVAAYASALGAPTTPDEVAITAGASEAADLLLTALVDEGDEVLLPAPGYPIYTAILNKLSARARYYRLDEARGWQPSPDEIRSLIGERTRALVLINPNNPTGAITPDETTAQLLELAARHNLLVISDEVYRDLCFAEPPAPASVLAQAMGTPLVTLESLSKTHMIPGWRVGWMRFTHAGQMRELMSAVGRLATGRLCSPAPAQYAVRPALEGGREFQQNFVREMRKRRDLAASMVESIEGLSCRLPEAAFYMMIRVDDAKGRTDEQFVLDLLMQTGVLVVNGSGFGPTPGGSYFRLVYLASEEILGQAFYGIRRFLSEL